MKNSVLDIFSTVLIMTVEAFAVFANGGYFPDAMTACVIGIWITVLIYSISSGTELYKGWNNIQVFLLGLALAFWLWAGISLSWSISPDESWIDFNRTGGYAAVFMMGIMVGKYNYCRRLAIILFLTITVVVAAYALGAKTFPMTIKNLDDLGRLAIPLGYVNALGLLVSMGYIVSIFASSDKSFHWSLRLFSTMSASLLVTCLFFTLSRGAALALILGLAAYFVISPVRLRSFGIMLISLIPTILVARWSSDQNALMKNHVDMNERVLAASTLRWYVILSLLFAGTVFTIFLLLSKMFKLSPILKKVAGTVILATIFISMATGTIWFSSSKSSFSDWSRQAYHDVRYGDPSNLGAERLLEMGSSGRWKLWEEALRSWQDHPYLGSGGQSFPLVHLMQRESGSIFLKQPHGHPFQLLAEYGLVGFLLGLAFISCAMAYSTLTLCRQKDRWEKGLAAAILSMLIVYLIHASYDWDWNMFGLTMAYFFFTGIMLGWPGASTSARLVAEAPDPGHPGKVTQALEVTPAAPPRPVFPER